MASIVKRRNKYCVIYRFKDKQGVTHQKWETVATEKAAMKRKAEVENRGFEDLFSVATIKTVHDLVMEYMTIYGYSRWAVATYERRKGLFTNYIDPLIGNMRLENVSSGAIDKYYKKLQKVPAKTVNNRIPQSMYVTPSTIREINKFLRSCFNRAVKWELIEKNPCEHACLPKETVSRRNFWNEETLQTALSLCDDEILSLAINLAFSCSLRIGEMLALTWDHIDISEKAIKSGKAYIYVDRELQRVNQESLSFMEGKDILFQFPTVNGKTATALVLKSPKTKASVRKVYLPETVARMLLGRKLSLQEERQRFGEEYRDYNLVFCSPLGRPIEGAVINHRLKKLIEKNNLPPVVFHSLRHSSITYKLKLSGGDIKMVQGDSGHSQASMVTEQYAHVLDEDRWKNAKRMEASFYQKETMEEALSQAQIDVSDDVVALLAKALSNPQDSELVKNLVEIISKNNFEHRK